MTADPPEGFHPHLRKSPVTDPWEPLFARETETAFHLGLWIAPAHCNGRGLLHGGVIAAVADNAMGISCVKAWQGAFGEGGRPLTASLQVDYLAVGEQGRWLEVAPRVVHVGRSSGVVDALVTADGAIIARAAATFRIPRPA